VKPTGGREAYMDLNVLLGQTADGVCGINGIGKIALWTQSAEEILGYSAREVMGRLSCEVFVERDSSGNRLCYRGCHALTLVTPSEPVQHVAMATRTKAGKPVWLDISILVVPGARPDASSILHLFRDVTASKEIETLVRQRLAQAQPAAPPDGAPPPELTRREFEILRLIASGANTRTIAERLGVSPTTVRNHIQNILRKLDVHSRLEAAAYVVRHRLL
jgi:PAS domain S-box-containing protein